MWLTDLKLKKKNYLRILGSEPGETYFHAFWEGRGRIDPPRAQRSPRILPGVPLYPKRKDCWVNVRSVEPTSTVQVMGQVTTNLFPPVPSFQLWVFHYFTKPDSRETWKSGQKILKQLIKNLWGYSAVMLPLQTGLQQDSRSTLKIWTKVLWSPHGLGGGLLLMQCTPGCLDTHRSLNCPVPLLFGGARDFMRELFPRGREELGLPDFANKTTGHLLNLNASKQLIVFISINMPRAIVVAWLSSKRLGCSSAFRENWPFSHPAWLGKPGCSLLTLVWFYFVFDFIFI